jgi:hypothetical protein
MNKTYQYIAGLQESTGEIIYSRARHDYRQTTDSSCFVDGGLDYFRHGWDATKGPPLKQVVIELEVSPAALYNDWNNRKDKFGKTHISEVRIVPPEEYEDRQSFAFKKKYSQWGTLGKDGLGPRRQVMLSECQSDHLQAILDTQNVGPEARAIIRSILADRGIKSD